MTNTAEALDALARRRAARSRSGRGADPRRTALARRAGLSAPDHRRRASTRRRRARPCASAWRAPAEAIDFPALTQKMAETAERVRGLYEEIVLAAAPREANDPEPEPLKE